jgi:hypothetical protein
VRRPSSSGLWLDRALCVLLALLSAAALSYGALTGDHGTAGIALFGLVGAAQLAVTLFDDAALRRARALREALDRVRH